MLLAEIRLFHRKGGGQGIYETHRGGIMVQQGDLFVMKNQRSPTPRFAMSYLVPSYHSRSPTVSSARSKQRPSSVSISQ